MPSKLSLSFVAALYVLAPQSAFSQFQQVFALAGGWVDLSAGQTAHGIRYAKDGEVWNDSNLVATCGPYHDTVHLSSPSQIGKLADNNSGFLQQRKTSQSSKTKQFTINRECDGGLCHFEIVSFNYGRNSSISVGRGDSSLFYYFSVQITKGKLSKEYIYSDGPERHFFEKQGGQRVDATLNRLLLDVHDLGNYIVDRDIAIRNRTFSETGRFAVLASLRTHF